MLETRIDLQVFALACLWPDSQLMWVFGGINERKLFSLTLSTLLSFSLSASLSENKTKPEFCYHPENLTMNNVQAEFWEALFCSQSTLTPGRQGDI